MKFEESSVLITGASQGIGRGIAVTFSEQTNRSLLLIARNQGKLEETKKLCLDAGAEEVEIVVCDLISEEDVRQIQLPEHFTHPGIIINNAGGYLYKTLAETTNKEFQYQVNVNLFTAVNTVNRFIKDLLQLDRALIVNICSIGGLIGLGDSGAYSAAKHAILGYTRSLREELKRTNIGVTAVNLGQTHSTSWEDSDMSAEKLIHPEDLAKLIITMTNLSSRSLVEEIIIQPQHGRVSPM